MQMNQFNLRFFASSCGEIDVSATLTTWMQADGRAKKRRRINCATLSWNMNFILLFNATRVQRNSLAYSQRVHWSGDAISVTHNRAFAPAVLLEKSRREFVSKSMCLPDIREMERFVLSFLLSFRILRESHLNSWWLLCEWQGDHATWQMSERGSFEIFSATA